VVLDTGRDSNNAGYTAAKAADLVLVPCRAGGFDFLALGRTLAGRALLENLSSNYAGLWTLGQFGR
jgi:cellulose biosynthesis protein BcsQ